MLLQLLYLSTMLTIVVLPAHAGGGAAAPELDSATLTGLAAAFTGCYAAFRVYKLKKGKSSNPN